MNNNNNNNFVLIILLLLLFSSFSNTSGQSNPCDTIDIVIYTEVCAGTDYLVLPNSQVCLNSSIVSYDNNASVIVTSMTLLYGYANSQILPVPLDVVFNLLQGIPQQLPLVTTSSVTLSGIYRVVYNFAVVVDSEIAYSSTTDTQIVFSVGSLSMIITTPTTVNPVEVGSYISPIDTFIAYVNVSVPSSTQLISFLGYNDFIVSVNNVPASFAVTYSLATLSYYFVVKPPIQSTGGAKNFTVSIVNDGFATATQPYSVLYAFTDFTTVNIAIIVDSSGSMATNDPNYIRVQGAQMLCDLANDGDALLGIDFSSSAYICQYPSVYTTGHTRWTIPVVVNATSRAQLRQSFSSVNADGGTLFETGFLLALAALNKSTTPGPKYVVLLTDGQDNGGYGGGYQYVSIPPGYQPSDLNPFITAGYKIFTIGLGASVSSSVLQEMSQLTGGQYVFASSAASLTSFFFQIFGYAQSQATVATSSVTMTNMVQVDNDFIVDNASLPLSVYILESNSLVTTYLISPSGDVYNEASSGSVAYLLTPTFKKYVLGESALTGTWILRLVGTGVSVKTPVVVSYSVLADNFLSLTATAAAPGYSTISVGNSLFVQAFLLSQDGSSFAATVTANIAISGQTPSASTMITLTLGQPGTYSGLFPPTVTPVAGLYYVTIYATGYDSCGNGYYSFTRQTTISVNVIPSTNPPSTISVSLYSPPNFAIPSQSITVVPTCTSPFALYITTSMSFSSMSIYASILSTTGSQGLTVNLNGAATNSPVVISSPTSPVTNRVVNGTISGNGDISSPLLPGSYQLSVLLSTGTTVKQVYFTVIVIDSVINVNSASELVVLEGSLANYSVTLSSQPTGSFDMVLNIVPSNPDGLLNNPIPASYTSAIHQWNQPQTVLMTAIQGDYFNNISYTTIYNSFQFSPATLSTYFTTCSSGVYRKPVSVAIVSNVLICPGEIAGQPVNESARCSNGNGICVPSFTLPSPLSLPLPPNFGVGVCQCNYGYFGNECENSCARGGSNNNICSNHGVCSSDVGGCVCFHDSVNGNWTGSACDVCAAGTGGVNCTSRCPSDSFGNFCYNNGQCENGVCNCLSGYYGNGCQNFCPGGASNPCSGNGNCDDGNLGDGLCVCDSNYFLPNCSGICPGLLAGNVCNGNGFCNDGANGNGACACNGNFDPSTNCGQCLPGFAGADCSIACLNCVNGQCDEGVTGTGQCICQTNPRFFYGSLCNLACPGFNGSSVCTGNGYCDAIGNCHCDPNYYGTFCENSCLPSAENACYGHGACNDGIYGDGTCVCSPSFTGPFCDIPVPENLGSCFEYPLQYSALPIDPTTMPILTYSSNGFPDIGPIPQDHDTSGAWFLSGNQNQYLFASQVNYHFNQVTLSVWIQFTDVSQCGTPNNGGGTGLDSTSGCAIMGDASVFQTPGTEFGYLLDIISTGQVRFRAGNDMFHLDSVIHPNILQPNTWYFISARYQSSSNYSYFPNGAFTLCVDANGPSSCVTQLSTQPFQFIGYQITSFFTIGPNPNIPLQNSFYGSINQARICGFDLRDDLFYSLYELYSNMSNAAILGVSATQGSFQGGTSLTFSINGIDPATDNIVIFIGDVTSPCIVSDVTNLNSITCVTTAWPSTPNIQSPIYFFVNGVEAVCGNESQCIFCQSSTLPYSQCQIAYEYVNTQLVYPGIEYFTYSFDNTLYCDEAENNPVLSLTAVNGPPVYTSVSGTFVVGTSALNTVNEQMFKARTGLDLGPEEVTISAWVMLNGSVLMCGEDPLNLLENFCMIGGRFTPASIDPVSLDSIPTAPYDYGYMLGINNDGFAEFRVANADNFILNYESVVLDTFPLVAGQFYFVYGVFSKPLYAYSFSSITVGVDDSYNTTVLNSKMVIGYTPNSTFYVGGGDYPGSEYYGDVNCGKKAAFFHGIIDNVKIYEYAVPICEVTELVSASATSLCKIYQYQATQAMNNNIGVGLYTIWFLPLASNPVSTTDRLVLQTATNVPFSYAQSQYIWSISVPNGNELTSSMVNGPLNSDVLSFNPNVFTPNTYYSISVCLDLNNLITGLRICNIIDFDTSSSFQPGVLGVNYLSNYSFATSSIYTLFVSGTTGGYPPYSYRFGYLDSNGNSNFLSDFSSQFSSLPTQLPYGDPLTIFTDVMDSSGMTQRVLTSVFVVSPPNYNEQMSDLQDSITYLQNNIMSLQTAYAQTLLTSLSQDLLSISSSAPATDTNIQSQIQTANSELIALYNTINPPPPPPSNDYSTTTVQVVRRRGSSSSSSFVIKYDATLNTTSPVGGGNGGNGAGGEGILQPKSTKYINTVSASTATDWATTVLSLFTKNAVNGGTTLQVVQSLLDNGFAVVCTPDESSFPLLVDALSDLGTVLALNETKYLPSSEIGTSLHHSLISQWNQLLKYMLLQWKTVMVPGSFLEVEDSSFLISSERKYFVNTISGNPAGLFVGNLQSNNYGASASLNLPNSFNNAALNSVIDLDVVTMKNKNTNPYYTAPNSNKISSGSSTVTLRNATTNEPLMVSNLPSNQGVKICMYCDETCQKSLSKMTCASLSKTTNDWVSEGCTVSTLNKDNKYQFCCECSHLSVYAIYDSSTKSSKHSGNSANVGAIVGSVFGVLIAVALVVYFINRRKSGKRDPKSVPLIGNDE